MKTSLCALLLAMVQYASAPPCIEGKLLNTAASPYKVIVAKASGQTQIVPVDANGAFQLCNLPSGSPTVDLLLYQGVSTDTLFLGTVALGQERIQLPVPAPSRSNILGQLICPKCHRADKTARIIVGDPPMVRMVITKGDTSYTNIVKRRMYVGCLDRGSRGYCSRDQINF